MFQYSQESILADSSTRTDTDLALTCVSVLARVDFGRFEFTFCAWWRGAAFQYSQESILADSGEGRLNLETGLEFQYSQESILADS